MPSMIWQTMSLGACFGEMDKLMSRLQRSLGCKRQKSWQFPNQRKIVQVAVKYMMKDDLPWNSSPQRTWFPAFVLRNPSMQLVILIHYLLWKDNRFWKPLPGSRPVAEWLLDGAGGGVCWSGRGVQLLSSKYQENDLLWFCLEVHIRILFIYAHNIPGCTHHVWRLFHTVVIIFLCFAAFHTWKFLKCSSLGRRNSLTKTISVLVARTRALTDRFVFCKTCLAQALPGSSIRKLKTWFSLTSKWDPRFFFIFYYPS